MNRAYELSRDVTQEECNWLPRTLGKGEKVYLYTGPTYGVVGLGIPVTEKPDELPFWEVPADALEFAKPYLEAENARLKELNQEMYEVLNKALHLLKTGKEEINDDTGDSELTLQSGDFWVSTMNDIVRVLKKARGEQCHTE